MKLGTINAVDLCVNLFHNTPQQAVFHESREVILNAVQSKPNHFELIQQRVKDGKVPQNRLVVALVLRTILFAAIQAMIALVFFASRNENSWQTSAAWWTVVAAAANLVTIFVLIGFYHAEGGDYREAVVLNREHLGKDLLAVLGLLIVAGPITVLPNYFVANALFGGMEEANALFILPLPLWAAIIGLVVFPATIAFAELPLYFGYVMPRLEALGSPKWLAVLIPSFFLGAQHCALPLIFDWRFMVWRFVMFLPFALLLGIALRWRPRLLPYLMFVHALLDLSAGWVVFSLSV